MSLKQGVRSLLAAFEGDSIARIGRSGFFDADDIAWICQLYFDKGSEPGSAWDALRHAHMRLPDWYVQGLDPLSPAYAAQQHRLWKLVSGVDREYEPDADEVEVPLGDADCVRAPGYFSWRGPQAISTASDHVIATGMFLKHCRLTAGDWALEYGAGFGQTALALARLGVNVDTVDISAAFCDAVTRQAEFFQVPLNSFKGRFGINPRVGHKYKLIWFYESFHHCLDFQNVVRQLSEHLAEGGRIILGGEPIVEREYAAVPYPWGVRLHSEVAAVMRKMHWFELGFSEEFLCELFTAAGFVASRVDCEPSLFGRLHVFERRSDEIHLGQQWLPTVVAQQWHAAELDGRWTKSAARLQVDARDAFTAIEVDISNPSARSRRAVIFYGGERQAVILGGRERRTVRFNAVKGTTELTFRCRSYVPAFLRRLFGRRPEALGIFVRRVRYLVRV